MKPRRRRPLIVRLLRLLAFAGLGLVVLLAAVVGFSETQTFRSLLRSTIIDAADSSLNARLSIESIEGNLFSGWVLSGVRLADDSGPVAEIERVVLRYNLFRAPWKRITINEVTLQSPRISITKSHGRDWNLSTLVRPSDSEDSTSSPFDWVIAVENFRILDGTLLVYDSTTPYQQRRDRLDGGHMLLEHLDIALAAVIAPDRKQLRINQCSWSNAFGDVSVQNLSGDVALRADGAEVDGLSVRTGRSAFILSAGATGGDILGGLDSETLRRLRFRTMLEGPNVDSRDLRYFLPTLDFIGGSAALRLSARGTLEDLRIERLQLDAARSSISFSGRLQRILDGATMHIDVRSDNTVIHGGDVPAILPGIPVPDVAGLGETRFSLLRFTGEPLVFEAAMDMESEAGAADGSITLDVRGEDLVYDGRIRTRGLDLSRVLQNRQLASDLNLSGEVRGSGTRLGRMDAQLRLRADSTRFQRYLANALTLNADVHPDSLRFDLRSVLGPSRLAADGVMSFRPDSVTGLRLNAVAERLDLAKLLDDDEMNSDLNFDLRAEADGVDLSTASGTVNMVIAPSRLKDMTIEPDTFHLHLRQRPGMEEQLLLESRYADARLEGMFDLPRFVSSFSMIVDSLATATGRYRLQPDSALAMESPAASSRKRTVRPARAEAGVSSDTAAFMDVRYTMTLKNPERIARFFSATTFMLRGTWTGSVRGGPQGFDIGGELALSDFYFIDSSSTWLAAGLRCRYDINDLCSRNTLESVKTDLRFSAMDLYINGLRLSRTQLDVDWKDGRPALRLRSIVDTAVQVDVQAEARYADHAFDVTLPRLHVFYRGEALQNRDPIQLRIDSGGIALQRFDLGNPSMRVVAEGSRSAAGINDFSLYADSLDIAALEYLLTGDPIAFERKSFSGIGFLEASFRGSDDAPLLAADVFIDSIGFRGATFGQMTLESRYARQKLELYSALTYDAPAGGKETVLFVSGSVPLALSFGEETPEPTGGSANLRMQLREFPLTLIEEFLGLFSPLHGVANGDFTVTGTASNPSFNGYLALADARGRFIFNNMDYDLGLRIEAVEQDIRIVDLTVANLPSDWTDGKLSATGRISTEEFSVKDFDLAVNGRLKVLKNASRSAIRTIYGDLYIATGQQELTYGGRLDRSMLRGDIIIEQGDLVFPLEQSAGSVNKYADISYVVVDDTTKQVVSSLSAGRFARLSAQASQGDAAARMPERSVLDGLGFALTLSTSGRLRLEIPFSVLQEELNAELIMNNLQVNNFGGSGVKFVGDVGLGPDSYFIFLGKRMTASGTMRFTRDPQNPDLDLRAVYSDWYFNPATEQRRQVYVIVKITGTRNAMKLDYDLRWDNEEGEHVASSGDVKSDVVSFLVLGVFTRDISGSEGDRSALVEKSPEVLQQITSSIASSAATEFLGKAGLQEYIRRVDFAGIGTPDSRFKLTSEIGRAIITYDGSFNSVKSANISVDFPLSRVLGIPWTNLMIQVSRRSLNEITTSTQESDQDAILELKILQRFTF